MFSHTSCTSFTGMALTEDVLENTCSHFQLRHYRQCFALSQQWQFWMISSYQLLSSTTITLNGKFSLIWWTTDCLDQQFIGNTWCSTEEIRLEFPGISTLGSHSGSSLWNLQENATSLTEFFSDNNTSKSTAVLCFTDSFNSF